jgi:hypothetical protein
MDTTDYEPDNSNDEDVAFEEQTSDEDPGNQSDLGESESDSESDGSDDSDLGTDPLDEYEVEGFAGF